jgi:drug/metabolite transporter (DMT)-like permease
VALACVFWGLDNNLTALVSGFTPAQTTAIKGAVAGAVNLAIGLGAERTLPSGGAVPIALAVGALAYGASILLYILGAQQLGASRSQLLFSSSPFLGMALSWLMLGEPVLGVQLAAAALMVAGILLMLSARHGHAHTHEAMAHTHSHRHDDGHHTHVHPGLPGWIRHTHPHEHEPVTHEHAHSPDLHHRHRHD